MLDNKALTILAAIGAIVVFIVIALSASSKEDFWNIPSRTWRAEKVVGVKTPDGENDFFFQTPNLQSPLSPRFSNVNYGPYLRTQLPEYNMMGVPQNPLNEDDAIGFPTDAIVYDRNIVANKNSRLRAQGDKIRGDLPIAPNSGNWFTPNVHPNIDLEAGAINVLAGVNNDTGKQLASLIHNASGKTNTAIGGVDVSLA